MSRASPGPAGAPLRDGTALNSPFAFDAAYVMDAYLTCGKMTGMIGRLCATLAGLVMGLHGVSAQAQTPERLCGAMDVVIVLDVSGSMWGALLSIQKQAITLLDDIDHMSAGDFRLGLVVFREHIHVLSDLDALPSPDAKKTLVAEALARLGAAGGEQIPELSAEALSTVLNRLPPDGRPQIGAFTGVFEADVRIVILITDQLPGGIDDVYTAGQDDVLAAELARKASSLGIKISAVYVPTQVWPDAETQRIMQTYANETLGLYIMTDRRGFGAGDSIADIVASCGERLMS
jgi:hypothetical protein